MFEVYIKVDMDNTIINIVSNLTLNNLEGYIKIDEGTGQKYAHAQNYYFPKEKPLRDSQGRCNYKYIDNKVVELAEEEKEKLFSLQQPQLSREEVLEQQLLQTQAAFAELQANILLNQGGTV